MKTNNPHNCGMDIRKVRKMNFDHLLEAECNGVNKVMADKLNKDPGFVSLYKNGRRNVGHAFARQLERCFQKESGWMDTYHEEFMGTPSVEERESQYVFEVAKNLVPILTSDQVQPMIDEGFKPDGAPEMPTSYAAADMMRLFAWIETSNANAPLLPMGTLYIISPTTTLPNGLLAAVLINDAVMIGVYDINPLGEATIACGAKRYELPKTHRLIGRVLQINPPPQ